MSKVDNFFNKKFKLLMCDKGATLLVYIFLLGALSALAFSALKMTTLGLETSESYKGSKAAFYSAEVGLDFAVNSIITRFEGLVPFTTSADEPNSDADGFITIPEYQGHSIRYRITKPLEKYLYQSTVGSSFIYHYAHTYDIEGISESNTDSTSEKIKERIKEIGYDDHFGIEIINSTDSEKREKYVNYLFKKMQREQGLLERDCDRLVRNDRVIWTSCMVACGDADGAVTGNTRRFGASLDKIKQVVDPRPGEIMFGLNMVVYKGKTIFIGDTSVHEYPSSEQLADIAISSSRVAKLFGFTPKVAFVSHSTFGQPLTSRTKHIKKAVEILKDKNGFWIPITYRARILVYSNERVKKSDLTTYEDLVNEKWKGRILVRSSSNAYNQALMSSIVANLGSDAASDWSEGIVKNFARDPKGSDRDQVKAIAAGQGDIAIVNSYYIGLLLSSEKEEELNAGKSVSVFFPNQGNGQRGSHINVSGIGNSTILCRFI